jgi:tetratricopeptide (TPR) repeat protein/tRNA A-37 threonylcarbamoyl transferase component Bud32
MEDNRSNRSGDDQPTLIGDAAGGSSSTGIGQPKAGQDQATPHPSDAPTMIDHGSDAPTMGGGGSNFPRAAAYSSTQENDGLLEPGTVLAQRYEILKTLGVGGMGAVYKARDRELDRMVALKVIRPDLARNAAIVERFKQELRLSHQVTHKNVIRIYDLGEGEGVKFITMEFIEGHDLRSLIQEQQKFPPAEAVEIMRQVCQALEAAHGVEVIHRDLKPQNIMRDTSGRILVMDFGLARTIEGDGMTQTGALVGTMDYMSPEQALGKDLDQRSDIFSLGLIFYELLTGKMPFKADSVLASLIKRTQERASPVSDHDVSIPGSLSNIVSKCLERDAALRYQSTTEILRDLEVWQGGRAAATLGFQPTVKPWGQTVPWPLLGGILTAVVLAIVGFAFRGKLLSPAVKKSSAPALSLAVIPFHNASGDETWDWLGPSLADMLSTDVGQSSHLRAVSPDRVQQVFHDLRIAPNSVVDSSTLGRIAEFANADTLVWGQYTKLGDQIRIDATLQDRKHDRTIQVKAEAANQKDISAAVDRLATSIRNNLAFSPDVIKELAASSFQPSSSSVEALRDYNQGIGFQRDGKSLDAQKQFEAATKADSNFALAFSKLAQTYSNLGYDSEAEQSAQKAVALSQNLPESEKYLISAILSQVMKNYPEAIKAYENLAQVSPDNSDVQAALASLYKDSGNLTKAREYYQRLLTTNPKDIAATLELGRIAIRSGDAQGSLDPLSRAYTLAIEMDNQEQKASSLHFMAVAYDMLSKPEESVRNEKEALSIWESVGQKRGLALSLNEMASAQVELGKPKDALANYQQALSVRREIGDKRGLGDTLIDLGGFYDELGDHDQALKMYKEALQLERDLGNESLQATCLNNIGSAYSDKGQYEDALTYFQQALQLREKSKVPRDIVEAVHNLGYTAADMGQYDQAISYYLRALDLRRSMDDRHGAAIESYGLGMLFDYQGRFGAAINSEQEALKTFSDIKDRTSWMAKMQAGFAESLILAGRGDEAKSHLDEAISLSRELKSDDELAEALGFQGDMFFYAGDFKSAHSSYEQALQAATRSKEPGAILIAKASLARVQVREKQSREGISSLRPLIQQADDLGLKYVSVESSIFMAEAMMENRDPSHARQELERALLLSDKLEMQPLSARAHYLLATIARDSGNGSDAQDHYREALRLLDAMKKDPGAEKLLQRADFKIIFEESTRGTQAAKT